MVTVSAVGAPRSSFRRLAGPLADQHLLGGRQPRLVAAASGSWFKVQLLLFFFIWLCAAPCPGVRYDQLIKDCVGHWIGTLLAAVSFVLGVVLFADLLGSGAEDRTLTQHLFSWIPVEGFQADVAFGSTSCR
ncbi:hypothetical protein SVIOM342S_03234 [Streptomyces violaceorubidus]